MIKKYIAFIEIIFGFSGIMTGSAFAKTNCASGNCKSSTDCSNCFQGATATSGGVNGCCYGS